MQQTVTDKWLKWQDVFQSGGSGRICLWITINGRNKPKDSSRGRTRLREPMRPVMLKVNLRSSIHAWD